jgi:hypothetical protein
VDYVLNENTAQRLLKLLNRMEHEPLSFAKQSPQLMPSVAQPTFVKISSTTATSSRYPGSVYSRNGNAQTWTTLGTCWLEFANGELPATNIYYNTRCVGVKESDGLPIFSTTRHTSKATHIHFTLPSALLTTDATKASCTVNDFWGGTDPGATVTCYNMPAASNYVFAGASGAKGLAVYDDIDDVYRMAFIEGFTGTVGDFYKYACVNGSLTQYTSTGFTVAGGLVQGDIAAYV